MNIIYPIISVVIVSLISIIFAIPLLIKKKVSDKVLLFLLSLSVGVSTVFINFLPEIVEHEYNILVGLYILLGFFIMFILEKFVHHRHKKHKHCHGHAYHLAPINLIGDSVHNFIDGLVIAGSYAINISTGIAATVSVIFHEIPQEVADFGVLLYSGMKKTKALLFNFLSATTAIIGTVIGIIMLGHVHWFDEFIIPFACGNFLYIAASNLLPELHRHCKLKDSLVHLLAIVIGVLIIVVISVYGPVHVH